MPASKAINPGRTRLHRLSDETVREIRDGYWKGQKTYRTLMAEYKISRDTLWRILKYKRYEWVE